MSKLKIVFIGQEHEMSHRLLQHALDYHSVVGIVTSSLRKKARKAEPRKLATLLTRLIRPGRKTFLQIGRERNIPYLYLTGRKHDDLLSLLKRVRPDLMCVVSMSQILKPEAFSFPPLGTINVHPSYLPDYRGPNPWFWQYYNFEKEGGVTIHYIDEHADTGDIIARKKYSIEPGESFSSVYAKATELAHEMFVDTLKNILTGDVVRIQQADLPCPHIADFVKSDVNYIKWNEWSIERCWHVLRGTTSWTSEIEPPQGWKAGLGWKIGEFIKVENDDMPGTVCKDAEGWYVAHRDGKIRLYVNFDLKSIFKMIACN